jgi:CRISPR-associated endonuclease/helicase Cas3
LIVVLINESEGKAWLRTRRILAKYLPQIGSRSWAGHISNEGLEDLHLALKKAASKAGSVSCHRVTGRNSLELQWIAGNKKQFDEVGRYAFRSEATKPTFDSPIAPNRKLLNLVVQLAALLHDVGKANAAFQGKLQGKYQAEYYRHDLMGYFMMCQSTENFDSDLSVLTALAEAPNTVLNWNQIDRLVIQSDTQVSGGEVVRSYTARPIWASVLWLVLTHHRLPDGNGSLLFSSHINEHPSDQIKIASKADCLQLALGELPWQNDGWLKAVSSTALQIKNIIDKDEALQHSIVTSIDDWLLLVAHWARPCLVYSDHLASIAKEENGDIRVAQEKHPLANTCREEAKSTPPQAGDSLTTHLIKTKRYARRTTLLASSPGDLFPVTTIPSSSKAVTSIEEVDYQWQQVLGDAIKLHGQGVRPAFVGIIAGTGCGKTLAGVRVMHCLREGKLRYTLALGLRSLTMQSAQGMLSTAGFNKRDVAVAIGQPKATQWANETGRAASAEREEADGIENTSTDDHDYIIEVLSEKVKTSTEIDFLPLWIQALSTENNPNGTAVSAKLFESNKHRMMIDTPVLACTADHLVAAVEMRTGGNAKMVLRMMTSDLLLDEIDAYSAQDLQSIGKLAMLTGMAGKNVVVMSATANDIVIGGIYNAWATGLRARKFLDGEQTDSGLVFLADQYSEPKVIENHTLELVQQNHHMLVQQMRTTHITVKQRLEVFDVSQHSNANSNRSLDEPQIRNEVFDTVFGKAIELHKANANINKLTEMRISCGFVRFNHAHHAWHFAKYLLERELESDEPEIRTLSYHSKHPRAVLGVMDNTLNQILNRKEEGNIWKHPAIISAIESAKKNQKQDVIVLISTTTLQETGRDHDYDWAILEPRSVRGEIQASGRVRRHRRIPWAEVNVAIMSHPLRAVFQTRAMPFWGLPGVEERQDSGGKYKVFGIRTDQAALDGLIKNNALSEIGDISIVASEKPKLAGGRPDPKPPDSEQSTLSATSALPISFWLNNGVNAIAALERNSIESGSLIGTLETLTQHLHLLSEKAASDLSNHNIRSLKQYLASPDSLHPCLTNHHAKTNRFRQSQLSVTLLVEMEDSGDVRVLEQDNNWTTQVAKSCSSIPTNAMKLDRVLINVSDLKVSFKDLMNSDTKFALLPSTLKWQLTSVQIDQYDKAMIPKTSFHLVLGFTTKNH